MNEAPRIVFFGTPGIAVRSLEALLSGGFPVVAVVTAPDRPAGRGLKMKSSEVKEFAISRGLELFQPEDLNDPDFLEKLKSLSPGLGIVVAFRKLPGSLWMLPPLGTFNLHASLLPQYRGAAPVNWALINGEKETGVTTFLLDQHIDTGKILLQEKVQILPDETAGELLQRLAGKGASLVVETAILIASGKASPLLQESVITAGSSLKKAPKIKPEDCRISWDQSASEIHNLIRGLSPVPGAFTILHTPNGSEILVKIYSSVFEEAEHGYSPGKVLTDGRSYLQIAANDGYIRPMRLQPSGKKVMEIGEFLRGFGRQFL